MDDFIQQSQQELLEAKHGEHLQLSSLPEKGNDFGGEPYPGIYPTIDLCKSVTLKLPDLIASTSKVTP
ncbi:hypothetical protein D6779_09580 [Candidatus Parcubacteria bacterium]|nr:MAG: hypothetical protein D6779_09580 [Candidatus Parcubacteria bacterium]